MKVLYNNNTRFPVKIWLDHIEDMEDSCLEQAYHLSNLPFLHKWACLMPDTHTGMGMPIGGVIAAKGVIIPNAVGVDIGCGMAFAQTNIPYEAVKDVVTGNGGLIQAIVGDIMRNIPVGYLHRREKMPSAVLDEAFAHMERYESEIELADALADGYYQLGTLGGGNHFIELQVDDEGYLAIMLHSGSRNVGKRVCDHFHKIAREHNERWYSQVPDEYRLAFLPVDTTDGTHYLDWMNLCMDFAEENRQTMLKETEAIFSCLVQKHTGLTPEFSMEINCHHNYAALEHHYGEDVWVHRKGATRARAGELAVIPGAMGSYSYVVRGLGCEDSFCTSSHGAGRKYSRKGAMEAFSTEEVMVDLKNQGVILGKKNKSDVAEESRFAYKDIDVVMGNQKDLVEPVKRLKTVGVVKG